jgi:putative AlgH/UPF0301 family transcriptional regulator
VGSKLAELVDQRVEPVKFFAGFVGWAVGQLEAELKEGLRLTRPTLPEHVIAYGDDLWQKLVGQIEIGNQ